ncbi:MAG TPA: hypothetical protein VF813_02125, partial [Anaerolineaceae bacterium]
MDLIAGPWQGLDAYAQAVFSGRQAFHFDPHLGLWLEQAAPIEVDLPELGLTPDQLDGLPTAKIAALLVAVNALKNAGLSPDSSPRVCVVAASSPETGDLSGYISRHWDLNGPAVDISAGSDWTAAALEKMDEVLASAGAEFGLLVGVNIPAAELPDDSPAGDSSSPPSLMYERDTHQLIQTHAAAAVVLRRLEDARKSGDRIYAVIEASSMGVTSPAAMSEVSTSAGAALPEVEIIETAASGSAANHAAEKLILIGAYPAFADNPSCALEGGAANQGDAGAAAGLLGMIRAALALYHRLIPAVPGWKAPSDPESWAGSAFYVPDSSRTWFTRPGQTRRLAAVDIAADHGALSHVILSREDDSAQRGNHFLALSEMRLFPLVGSSLNELLADIDRLQQAMGNGLPLPQIARQAYQSSLFAKDAPLGLGLIAASTDDLGREIEFARKGLPKAFERGSEWQTPAGSYCTPVPVGRSGGVAFVYPGAFNTFLGLGKDLFQLFPSLYPRFAQLTRDMGGVLHETSLYPRRMEILSQKELDELEASLSQDPIAMLTSGIGLAVLYTRILRNVFGVHPQAAFGYSLGETSMLFALDIWRDGDAGNQR